MSKTLGQERAKFAFEKVESTINENHNPKEYKSLVKSFPSMVINNGLGPALAFLKAKGKPHHLKFYKDLNDWFKNENSKIQIAKDLLEEIMNEESDKYRYLTEETLLLLNWFKKFVDAEIGGE